MNNERGVVGVSAIMLLCATAFGFARPERCVLAQDVVSPRTNEAASDVEIIADVRRQVEALPKDKQVVVGTEILRAALSKLRTRSSRQRVLVSLGDLYAEQGVLEEASQFYSQAIEEDSSSELAAFGRLKAVGVFRLRGKNEEADRLVQELHAVRKQGRDGKASLDENVVAAIVDSMIGKGQFDEAVGYCRDLSREFPASRAVLVSCAEKVPFAFRKDGMHEERITWYEKIYNEFEAAKNSPGFNCNYISALRYCDPTCDESQLDRLRRAIDTFAVSFPADQNVPLFFATYADICYNKGDKERAEGYYKKAIEHPLVPSEVKQAIAQVLADRTAAREEERRAEPVGDGSTVKNVLMVNAGFLVAVVLWRVYWKRRGST